MVQVEDILKFRHWEQGRRVNFGKLFSYISTVREMQKELECGKVFPAAYLATYSRHKDKNYVLIVDMIKHRDSVYSNKPLLYGQLVVGSKQVIVKIMDLNAKDKLLAEVIYDSDEKVLKIAKGLLELFKKSGVLPVKTADLHFGAVMDGFQTSFDDTFELLGDEDLGVVYEKLKGYDFELEGNGCIKNMGSFVLNISHKNIYKDYIITLIDNNDQSNVHWAIKDENLEKYVEEMQTAYGEWLKEKQT